MLTNSMTGFGNAVILRAVNNTTWSQCVVTLASINFAQVLPWSDRLKV